ncbi:aminotransferase class I/II-fold pyridoxal phosphate-dependent enzyme [Ligilactobacillus ceti]|nr:methionine gamma-lyase family protein [Ligilactobacillus ceti]
MNYSWLADYPTELQEKIKQVEAQVAEQYAKIDDQILFNQKRVLALFREHHVSEADLVGSTGYGCDDMGRDKLDAIYAGYFKTEDALVRPQFVSGTHAIATALYGVLKPGETLHYLTGMPYDTIQQVIGIAGDNSGTMQELGMGFSYTPLLENGKVDYEQAKKDLSADPTIKVIALQRSRGYETRASYTVAELKEMIDFIREIIPEAIIFVDNCYGEFSEASEPSWFGADLMAGSLFKNAGAGIAKTGGYIVGKKDLVEKAATRLTIPGVGKNEGATYPFMRDFYQGFFMAAHTTGQAIKGMIFTSALLESVGMDVSPKWDAPRTDVVQAVVFNDPKPMIDFCGVIQNNSPLNAFVNPIPSPMDGYEDEVIMASGSFTEGSTIELSSDGPIRPPYCLYIQGGLTVEHVKIAIASAVNQTFYQ